MQNNNFDVIVVGAGHAGLEAAIASAKMGLKTRLFTILIQNIALASCNPAVGGLGKGHLVKELDALGGVMGQISDICGLQYRTLNASKGPAVRGTRAQIDMDTYSVVAKKFAFETPNLSVTQELITDLILDSENVLADSKNANSGATSKDSENTDSKISESKKVIGVKSNLGNQYFAKAVILTTGTFLKGLVHLGETKLENGRFGELSAQTLSNAFTCLNLQVGRLKTGTCARIDGRTINFENLERHDGDENPPHFSNRTKDFSPEQIPCFVTYTNERTHEIIRENFHRAPMFTGQIQGVGPRYCPSIEDKVNRFADKSRHQLFLEPMSRDCAEYYINGLTTSLPCDVQEKMIRSIQGLENAHITRFGYAIEYDFVQPTELKHNLECKKCENLFLAGQINGTTGYEEAAAQGLMAGINAALKILGREPLILRRDEAYIGVMIDDLVTKGTNEPYRVFTSRAEFRLLLREDNAVFRLGRYGRDLGLISESEFAQIQRDCENIQCAMQFLENGVWTPSKANLEFLDSVNLKGINDKSALVQILSINELDDLFESIQSFCAFFGLDISEFSARAKEQICIQSKYFNYILKQAVDVKKMREMLGLKIPQDFDFDIKELGLEAVEKLKKVRPKSLFEASEISGITPANLEVLQIRLHLLAKKQA